MANASIYAFPILIVSGLLGACNSPAEAGVPEEVSVRTERARPVPEQVAMGFSVLSDLKRKGGVEEGGALVCRKDSCAKGIVAFGPYTRAVPAGPRVATFRVRGDGVSTLARGVATVDVYDALSKQRLGRREVKGTELPDQQDQDIALAFTAPEKSNLEFRISWVGDGELRMYRVDVR